MPRPTRKKYLTNFFQEWPAFTKYLWVFIALFLLFKIVVALLTNGQGGGFDIAVLERPIVTVISVLFVVEVIFLLIKWHFPAVYVYYKEKFNEEFHTLPDSDQVKYLLIIFAIFAGLFAFTAGGLLFKNG